MTLDFVLDIGNSRIKGGLFQEKALVDHFSFPALTGFTEQFTAFLKNRPIRNVLIASVNTKAQESVQHYLKQQNINHCFLDYKNLKMRFDVDEPEQLGHDRIANAYGALARFPLNDCLVVDIGTAITVDFIVKEGRYLGGMIYLGEVLCAKALAEYTDKLPLITPKKPPSALAKTTETHLQAGIYYGQLGAIERMISELSLCAVSPSSVKIIATGGTTAGHANQAFLDDLGELVDVIDPQLTLFGLHEILEENSKNQI
jgi:type III pantothenate kinase